VVGYAALFGVGLLRTIYGLAPVELLDASTLGYLLPAAQGCWSSRRPSRSPRSHQEDGDDR